MKQKQPQLRSGKTDPPRKLRFEDVWLSSSHFFLMVLVFSLRLCTIYRAKHLLWYLLWIVFDFTLVLILVYIMIDYPKRPFYLNLYFWGYAPFCVMVYQILYGPGGHISIIAGLFSFIIVTITEYTVLVYVIYYSYYVALCTYSFHYLGGFSVANVLYIDFLVIAIAALVSTQMKQLKLLMQKTHRDEKELLEHRTKHLILSTASHELRNPLHALTFLAADLDSTKITDQSGLVQDINWAIQILNSIIENSLDYSKLETKSVKINDSMFDLATVVENTIQIFTKQANHKGIKLYNEIDLKIPSQLFGDAVKLTQIVVNMVSNSMKHTSDGHVIISTKLVTTSDTECIILFKFTDTGLPIPKEKLDNLFNPITKLDENFNIIPKHRGWALGLSITKNLVEILGGTLEVSSDEHETTFGFSVTFNVVSPVPISDLLTKYPNQHVILMIKDKILLNIVSTYLQAMGVQFDINEVHQTYQIEKNTYLIVENDLYKQKLDNINEFERVFVLGGRPEDDSHGKLKNIPLPIRLNELNNSLGVDCTKTTTPTIRMKTHCVDLKNLQILIVEDDQLIHKIERKVLTDRGAKVTSAYNGNEAVDKVNQNPPFDCIIMDIKMPIMDGITSTNVIRHMIDPIKAATPVLIVSGNFMNINEVNKCGANEILSKPINLPNWVAAIHRVVNKR
jgi:two-component system sensor histidine kinase/response regulator